MKAKDSEEMLVKALEALTLIWHRCNEVVISRDFETWNRADFVATLNAVNDVRQIARSELDSYEYASQWSGHTDG